MSREADLTTEEWREIVLTAGMSHRNAVALNLRPVIQRILAARVASAAADRESRIRERLDAYTRWLFDKQNLIARDAGLSEKHVSQMLTGQVDGSLRAWQRMLVAAGLEVHVTITAAAPVSGVAARAKGTRR